MWIVVRVDCGTGGLWCGWIVVREDFAMCGIWLLRLMVIENYGWCGFGCVCVSVSRPLGCRPYSHEKEGKSFCN